MAILFLTFVFFPRNIPYRSINLSASEAVMNQLRSKESILNIQNFTIMIILNMLNN